MEKIYFVRKLISHAWTNLVYIITFVLLFFRVLIDTVRRPKILGNGLGILTYILTAMDFYFFFPYFSEVSSI